MLPRAVPHASWRAAETAIGDALKARRTAGLVGAAGSGKTMLLTALSETLRQSGLHAPVQGGRAEIQINGVDAILIDDADRLDDKTLLRLRGGRVPCVLAGQPALSGLLGRLGIRVDIHELRPLSAEEIAGFVEAQVSAADLKRRRFTPAAVARLGELTGGNPRETDVLGRLATFMSGLEDADTVTERHVQSANSLRDSVETQDQEASSETDRWSEPDAPDVRPVEVQSDRAPGERVGNQGGGRTRARRAWAVPLVALAVVAALVLWVRSEPSGPAPSRAAAADTRATLTTVDSSVAPMADQANESVAIPIPEVATREVTGPSPPTTPPAPEAVAALAPEAAPDTGAEPPLPHAPGGNDAPGGLPAEATVRVVVSVPLREKTGLAAAKTMAAQLERTGLRVPAPVTRRDGSLHGILYFFAQDEPAARRVALAVGGDAAPSLLTGDAPPGTVEVALPLAPP